MGLTYQKTTTPTPEQLKLLLLADPSRQLLATYLPHSTIYAASDHSGLAGIVVLCPQSKQVVEIMTIAVIPAKQRQGYGRQLLEFSRQWAAGHGYQTVRIATGTTSLTQLYLYQQVGFRVVAVEPDYFTTTYSQVIIENGLTLRDRLVLELAILPTDGVATVS
ncbi:GNAT family N-acetyltransferase [Levilactobacillus enshiensis]|uniref:GNAT family N-acetyltransferase n=1 Tax=Levilactobacillus enshiensis TaxID=2590213 RepID=UPI00131D3553|nr:GNAT family N-acetyltransferase [Levilactobacillus enshiensis]